MEKAPLYAEISECPKNGTAYWVPTKDNVRLRIAFWKPDYAQSGTVLIFPGRTEYIEKYGRTISELDKYGLATFIIDWRGQGLSDRFTNDRMTGHVVRFSDYQKDVAAMINAAHELDLPKPWYLLGHSLGACIGLGALIEETLPVSFCAFTAPMWNIKLPALKRALAWPLSLSAQAFGKGHIYAPGTQGKSYVLSTPFEENRLTHDPDMYKYFISQAEILTDHQIGGPSLGWLFEVLKETKRLSKLPSPNIPCVTFCGDDDQLVNITAVQHRMAHWPNGTLELIKNAKHDVLSENMPIRKNIMTKISKLFKPF